MNVEKFTRKSFPVEGVQVTAANMEEVASWCDGDIRVEDDVRYIKVRVHNPINERQTKAHVGDWVLYAGKGYKIYKDQAFKKSFDSDEFDLGRNKVAVAGYNPEVVEQNKNAFEQGAKSPLDFVGGSSAAQNPGGTRSI